MLGLSGSNAGKERLFGDPCRKVVASAAKASGYVFDYLVRLCLTQIIYNSGAVLEEANVKFMNFYPFNDIETISPRPMLFITGDKAHSREFSEDAFQRAAQPKELYIVPDAGHVDLYDRTDLIPFAKLTAFFQQHL